MRKTKFNSIMRLTLDEHSVFVNRDSGVWCLANDTAADILARHFKGCSAKEICEILSSEYGGNSDSYLPDVLSTLESVTGPPQKSFIQNHQYQLCKLPPRGFRPIQERFYQLGANQYCVTSECTSVLEFLDEMIGPWAEQITLGKLTGTFQIYEENGVFPIVRDNDVLDSGYAPGTAAARCLREMLIDASQAEEYVATFHASALAKDGQGVLFPAVGGSGKTTLAAYLMSHGYQLLNDDIVPLNASNMRLVPFETSLCLKEGSLAIISDIYPALANSPMLGRYAGQQVKYLKPSISAIQKIPLACAAIIFPTYSAGGIQAISEITPTTALERLSESGCVFTKNANPNEMQSFLDWLKLLPCYSLQYHSLDYAKAAIDDVVSKSLSG